MGNRDRAGNPRTARHPIEDLLRQLDRLRRRAEYPKPAWSTWPCRAPCRCSTRRPYAWPACSAWRSTHGSTGRTCSPARTTSTPTCRRATRPARWTILSSARGHLDITLEDGTTKRIGITRAHLEEDAGKSLHEDFQGMSGIDLNRAGTPLLEIVSEPDIRSAKEAVAYVKAIHALVRYLGICDGNMAEGSLRCDCNVSVRPKGQAEFGTRAEIKNVNSFRFIEKAINHEIQRQIEADRGRRQGSPGNPPVRPEQGRDPLHARQGRSQRLPLLPCPDLLPVVIEPEYLAKLREQLPELPVQKRERFREPVRPVRLRCQRAVRQPRDGRLLREGPGHLRRRQAGGQLGDGRAGQPAQQGRPGDRGSPRCPPSNWAA